MSGLTPGVGTALGLGNLSVAPVELGGLLGLASAVVALSELDPADQQNRVQEVRAKVNEVITTTFGITLQELFDTDLADLGGVLVGKLDEFLNHTSLKDLWSSFNDAFEPIVDLPLFLDKRILDMAKDAQARYVDVLERVGHARAKVTEAIAAANEAIQHLDDLTDLEAAAVAGFLPPTLGSPQVAWEYWNGRRWTELVGPRDGNIAANLLATGTVSFTAPGDWEPNKVSEIENRWLRARLTQGAYGLLRIMTWTDNTGTDTKGTVNLFPVVEPRPPMLDSLQIGYLFDGTWDRPDRCLTFNDFEYADRTAAVRERGSAFPPYRPVDDRTPALYLGFDGSVPAESLGFYLDIEEAETSGPQRIWEHWDGRRWRELATSDGTANLTRPGMLELVAPGNTMPLPRFGSSLSWVRSRRREDGPPTTSWIRGLYPNAVWVTQTQTLRDELLGSSNGHPKQVLFFRQTPVLEGQVVEVRELEGARAEVERPMLERELRASAMGDDDVRVVSDAVTGRAREVWVRWRERPHLFFSGPNDRHYVIERTRGRLLFGDGERGRIPTAGTNNIRAQMYRSGGGVNGNVPEGAIKQLLGAGSDEPTRRRGGRRWGTPRGRPHSRAEDAAALQSGDHGGGLRSAGPTGIASGRGRSRPADHAPGRLRRTRLGPAGSRAAEHGPAAAAILGSAPARPPVPEPASAGRARRSDHGHRP